ncbi:hypothetical protein BDP27DRAFT_1476827 [Rhodocollybia butyracea]|uniref:Uncharacterized protein n=1 Tax=Rhodocollybia butyracea TaxID=206335 RepID=A0A9P5UCH4_9AGAR|nr:hypothetical protein BDP27DRAFT_1476827 [Rhodocollybia butyracea]
MSQYNDQEEWAEILLNVPEFREQHSPIESWDHEAERGWLALQEAIQDHSAFILENYGGNNAVVDSASCQFDQPLTTDHSHHNESPLSASDLEDYDSSASLVVSANATGDNCTDVTFEENYATPKEGVEPERQSGSRNPIPQLLTSKNVITMRLYKPLPERAHRRRDKENKRTGSLLAHPASTPALDSTTHPDSDSDGGSSSLTHEIPSVPEEHYAELPQSLDTGDVPEVTFSDEEEEGYDESALLDELYTEMAAIDGLRGLDDDEIDFFWDWSVTKGEEPEEFEEEDLPVIPDEHDGNEDNKPESESGSDASGNEEEEEEMQVEMLPSLHKCQWMFGVACDATPLSCNYPIQFLEDIQVHADRHARNYIRTEEEKWASRKEGTEGGNETFVGVVRWYTWIYGKSGRAEEVGAVVPTIPVWQEYTITTDRELLPLRIQLSESFPRRIPRTSDASSDDAVFDGEVVVVEESERQMKVVQIQRMTHRQ